MLKQFLASKQRRRNFSRSLMTVPALENIGVFFPLLHWPKIFIVIYSMANSQAQTNRWSSPGPKGFWRPIKTTVECQKQRLTLLADFAGKRAATFGWSLLSDGWKCLYRNIFFRQGGGATSEIRQSVYIYYYLITQTVRQPYKQEKGHQPVGTERRIESVMVALSYRN